MSAMVRSRCSLRSGSRAYSAAWLYAAALLCSFSLLVKASYGLASALLLFAYGLYASYERRKPALLLLTGAAFLASVHLIWFLLNGGIAGFYRYLEASYHFSQRYSSAMSYHQPINWIVLGLWYAAFVAVHDWMYRQHTRFFRLTEEQFDAIHYGGMAALKLAVIVFNLAPYLALRIVG